MNKYDSCCICTHKKYLYITFFLALYNQSKVTRYNYLHRMHIKYITALSLALRLMTKLMFINTTFANNSHFFVGKKENKKNMIS